MDLFQIQALMYTKYHITEPDVLFNGEDIWAFPTEKFIGDEQVMEPYYVIMKLPGQTDVEEEFALILPFTPAGKTISIAWLAVKEPRCPVTVRPTAWAASTRAASSSGVMLM